ncbi:MAG TPA: hypothetical protein VN901_13420 [Candidatus Acidoferrales bacterium]|nr:hypothetical protein [Candidatus Acidoferrales bacterium]
MKVSTSGGTMVPGGEDGVVASQGWLIGTEGKFHRRDRARAALCASTEFALPATHRNSSARAHVSAKSV